MATDLFLPADGLRLLGQQGGGGYDGRRFLVGRSDGEVIALPLLPYLIMAAIAEGGVDGGWSADQIGARVGTASGQGLTADTVRYLVAGKLAPVGLIAADGGDRPAGAADPEQPPGRTKPPRRRRRWGLAVGGAAVLVCVAATAPIMAETGTGETGRARSALSLARRRRRRRRRRRASASFGAGAARVDARAIAPAVPAAVRSRLRPSRPPWPRPAASCSATRTSRLRRPPGRRWRTAGSTRGCSRSCHCSPPSCRSGCWPSSARPAPVQACRCAEPRSASPRLPPGPPSSACLTLSRASTGRPR